MSSLQLNDTFFKQLSEVTILHSQAIRGLIFFIAFVHAFIQN